MDPILIGAGLAALIGGARGAARAREAKQTILGKLHPIEETKAVLEWLGSGRTPEEAWKTMQELSHLLPHPPKTSWMNKIPFIGKKTPSKEEVARLLNVNYAALETRSKMLERQIPNETWEAIKGATMWGGATLLGGKLVKKLIDAKQQQYDVYYPYYG